MSLEIEAKLKVADFQGVLEKLAECGATLVGAHLEVNTFFDTEDGSLLAADKGLRMRVIHDRKSEARSPDETIITLKGPRQPGAFKSREETEITVDSAQNAATLLKGLGFAQVLSFEKRRQSWKLKGCKVELDEVPYLGRFVEIEGPREALIAEVRTLLGLAGQRSITSGYAGLLMDHLQDRGNTERRIVFPPDSPVRA